MSSGLSISIAYYMQKKKKKKKKKKVEGGLKKALHMLCFEYKKWPRHRTCLLIEAINLFSTL